MKVGESEIVEVLVNLKCGGIEYRKGEVIQPPLPYDIRRELEENTGTVKILSVKEKVVPKVEEVVSTPEVPENDRVEEAKEESSGPEMEPEVKPKRKYSVKKR